MKFLMASGGWRGSYLSATKATILFLNLFADLELPGKKRIDRKRIAKAFVVAVYVFYFYSSIKLLISITLSYKYDLSVHDYKRFISALMKPNDCDKDCASNFTLLAAGQVDQVMRARANVKLVGAPYLATAFATEATQILLLVESFYAFIILHFYFNLVKPLKSELICLILNEKEGRKWVQRMMSAVIRGLNCHQRPAGRSTAISRRQLLHKPIDFHLLSIKAQGKLWPTNRRSDWLIKLCSKFCNISLALGFCQLGLGVFLMYGAYQLPSYKGYHILTGPLDLLLLAEIILLTTMTFLCIELYVIILFFNLMDQTFTATALARDCRTCVLGNELSFLVSQKQTSQEQEWTDQRDRSLLEVILKFKLFRRQSRATLSFNNFIVFLTAAFGAYGPIIVFFNGAYMDNALKLVMFGFLILILLIVTLVWLPTCYMYSRCEDIYRALNSLMAHIVWLQGEHEAGYQPMLVDLLYRELAHPKKLLDDFACQFLGIRFTYKNIIKYLFFNGVVVIAAYFMQRDKDNPGTSLFAFL